MRYIFPGGELDDIGHTVQEMEMHGLEVQDVENLAAALRADHAGLVRAPRGAPRRGRERWSGRSCVRLWLASVGGVSLAFSRGTLRGCQTLVGGRTTPTVSTATDPRANLCR